MSGESSASLILGSKFRSLIVYIVDRLDASKPKSQDFAAALEDELLLNVDRRARAIRRAEVSEIAAGKEKGSFFSHNVDEINREIASLHAKMEGGTVEHHLQQIHKEDDEPEVGFLQGLVRSTNKKIAEIKAQIKRSSGLAQGDPSKTDEKGLIESGVDEANRKITELEKRIYGVDISKEKEKYERDPHERDDLQTARSKSKERDEPSLEEKIKLTREKIRITELKLQAYRELAKILQGHIQGIEENIKKGKDISQDDVDKLTKFKDAAEKFAKKIEVFGKKKEELNKEQQENLRKQKIERYREIESQLKSRRRELAAAQSAERSAREGRSIAGFILPGDFFKIVQKEQEAAAERRSDMVEAQISSLASKAESAGVGVAETDVTISGAKSSLSSEASKGKAAVAAAQLTDGIDTSLPKQVKFEKPEKDPVESKAKEIDAILGIDSNKMDAKLISKPAPTPVTEAVKERKAKEAREAASAGYYVEMSKKGKK